MNSNYFTWYLILVFTEITIFIIISILIHKKLYSLNNNHEAMKQTLKTKNKNNFFCCWIWKTC